MSRHGEWVQATASVFIKRRMEDVFTFVCDPMNDPLWMLGNVEVEKLTSGEVGVDTIFRHTATLMGRRVTAEWKVVQFQANQSLHCESLLRPLAFEGGYKFAEKRGLIQVTKYGRLKRSHVPPFVPKFLIETLFSREFETSLDRLKIVLEGPG